MKLWDFAKSMFDRFEAAGIPLLLAGGWAVSAHGFPRSTLDLDWICQRSRQADARDLMKKLGFELRSDGMASRFQYGQELAFPIVDVIWVNDKTFDKMRGPIDESMGVRIVTFESLVAMKLHALKDDEKRKGRDLRDLQELLARNRGKIPVPDLKAMCQKYADSEILPKLGLTDD